MAWHNPFAFRPLQVTFWTTIIYLAVLIPEIYINEIVPPAPTESRLPSGISLDEAWADLGELTRKHHPENSRANDATRNWLLLRIQEILDGNGADWATEKYHVSSKQSQTLGSTEGKSVVVFDDKLANVTVQDQLESLGTFKDLSGSIYYEGSNIYVYIRGTDDEDGDWWRPSKADGRRAKGMKGRGVLVNSHFDAVSTSYGATDDGIGVVTCLQLIKHFTLPDNRPRRGVVVLINNGEEDGLLGAQAFANSPLASFVGTFVNLEGAGAGGRAIMFRNTDYEVTKAYRHSPHPFGTVFGNDVYKLGLIKSGTDFSVWVDALGYRGVDLAFFAPRSRYHTVLDDRRHTSRDSIWHMLSAGLATATALSGDVGDEVERSTNTGVWFDLFGDSMVVMYLRGMFAWSLVVLIVSPLALILVGYLIHKLDKDFIGKYSVKVDQDGETQRVPVGGLKGLFRFPFALAISGALSIGAAFLLRKQSPYIVHSSPYSVWAMMLTLFYFSFWCIMKAADFARPSALHRAYVHIWLFVLSWAVLVAVTVLEDRMQIASGYMFVFWGSQMFLATLITFLDFFGLPKKKAFARQVQEDDEVQDHLNEVPHHDAIIAPSSDELDSETAVQDDDDDDNAPATEATPLIGGGDRSGDDPRRTTFASGYRRSISALIKASQGDKTVGKGAEAYEHEQEWSASMPGATWLLQFLFLAPFMVILTSQLGFVVIAGIHQTGPDGTDQLTTYLAIAVLSIVLLLPLTPFIHRVTHHVPLFFLTIFIGTLLYNLLAFPFSPESPFKLFFQQRLDLDTGNNTVVLTGVPEYVKMIAAELPSAAGQPLHCIAPAKHRYKGLNDCSYDGSSVAPNPNGDKNVKKGMPPELGYSKLVTIEVTGVEANSSTGNKATFRIDAQNTRTCTLLFNKPVGNIFVHGSVGWDERFGKPPDDGYWGLKEMELYRREWAGPWVVDVEWDDAKIGASHGGGGGADKQQEEESDELRRKAVSGLDGYVACRWSDANTPGVIPALDEVKQFAPSWAAVTKAGVGLVEGRKSFMV